MEFFIVFSTGIVGLVLAFAVYMYLFIFNVRPNRKITECDDKDCVRCKKYTEIKEKAVVLYRNYIDDCDSDLLRIQSSVNDINQTRHNRKQCPNVFFMKSLKSQPWLSETNSDIEQDVNTLETNMSMIQSDFVRIIDSSEDHWLINNTPNGFWEVFHLVNQGTVVEKNTQLVPKTYDLIKNLKSAMLNTVFGNVAFSVVYPGTTISDHYGPTNIRLRCHLGLQTSPFCSIVVDGQKKSWRNGKVILFDDSYLHGVEYTHDVRDENKYRAVLMMDMWHPDITKEEQKILSYMFPP
ncbi:aspartate beta-hydroxylase domain-containing protein 2-like isoform X1 [Mytilus trossulus]|uniref:aspartate beta-hydroxylase domain-containing protein 2-like isoform X1 n=1 Tax=Mytilus trossulus TaxID=6551 RepID=UPI00300591FE